MPNNFNCCALSNSCVDNRRLDETQEQPPGVAAASAQGWPPAAQRYAAGRSCTPHGCVPCHRVRMETARRARRLSGIEQPVRGRPARLDAAMREQLARALLAGARSHGYATELWTLPRIAKLIEEC